MPKYKIYPTLLDAFQYYLESEAEDALEQLLNKINRVPFTSEAAAKGTAFNNLIDALIDACQHSNLNEIYKTYLATPNEGKIFYEGFEFKRYIVEHFFEALKYSNTQVFTKAMLDTRFGEVELYGFIDNLLWGSPSDIKTTSRYEFPKFLGNWQHLVYPYCLIRGTGVMPNSACIFSYRITDFNNIAREDYIYVEERDLPKLRSFIEHFIDFLEANRDKITDKKVFALDEQRTAEPVSA